MKNNNGIFIRAKWCDLKILLLVVFQQWLSSSYLTAHQAAHRIFSQKQSSSESRVCIIFLLLSLIHCYCYFSSNFFLSPSLPCSERCCCCFVCVALHSIPLFTHPTSAQRSYLFWTPASMPEIAIVFWYLFFFFFHFIVDARVFSIPFVWGALITLHVRVRIKSNGYAYQFVCTYFFPFYSGHKNSSSLIFIHFRVLVENVRLSNRPTEWEWDRSRTREKQKPIHTQSETK